MNRADLWDLWKEMIMGTWRQRSEVKVPPNWKWVPPFSSPDIAWPGLNSSLKHKRTYRWGGKNFKTLLSGSRSIKRDSKSSERIEENPLRFFPFFFFFWFSASLGNPAGVEAEVRQLPKTLKNMNPFLWLEELQPQELAKIPIGYFSPSVLYHLAPATSWEMNGRAGKVKSWLSDWRTMKVSPRESESIGEITKSRE